MLEITYDYYERMLEAFERIKDREKVPVFWPTVIQFDQFEKDPEKWINFCCYLYECNPAPKTAEEKYSKKNLQAFINRHLELTE